MIPGFIFQSSLISLNMFRNYIKIAFRSLWKNRLFTGINLLGLSLGLASAVILILFIQRGLTFDTFHKDSDQIYFIQTADKENRYNQTVYPILDQLLKTYPEIEQGTHVQGWGNVWISHNGKDIQGNTKYVDSTFFDIFSFPLQYGNPSRALKDRQSIVINSAIAATLFGDTNPVGETVTVNDTLHYTVTGVLDPVPANSSIQFDVLVPIANLEADKDFRENADWYNTFATVYIKLKKGTRVDKLESQFPKFVKTHFAEGAKERIIHMAPIKDFIHFQNPFFKSMIYGAMTIAGFILLIISINLINLNTAVSFTRAKEIAVRKVTGSTLRQILIQFWLESGIVLVASLLLSITFAVTYLIPQFNEFRQGRMQLMLNWEQDYVTLLVLLAIVCVITFLAGTYPAMYLHKLDIRNTIKGTLTSKPQTKGRTKSTLIVLQFVLTIVLILGALSVRMQTGYMRNAPVGFDKDKVVIVESDRQYKNVDAAMGQFKGVLDALKTNPHVKSISTSGVVPTKYWNNYNVYFSESEPGKEIRLRQGGTSSAYAETYKIGMMEGRDFSDELDKNGENNPVVINETAMKALGWKTAVGKRLRPKSNNKVFTVIGVTKDFHYQELKALNSYLTIRFADSQHIPEVLAGLEKSMKLMPAKKPFKFFYLSEEISRQYNDLDGIWKMVNFVTLLSIVIAFAGIFGLITLAANQRTKEVGIRKVLGASVQGIAILLSKDFVILVLISIAIGTPLAYIFVKNYLQKYQYHITMEWYTFVMVGASALLLTVLTVGFQSIKAAMMDPVKSLKSE
jgi:putative ABC transport system permease protein